MPSYAPALPRNAFTRGSGVPAAISLARIHRAEDGAPTAQPRVPVGAASAPRWVMGQRRPRRDRREGGHHATITMIYWPFAAGS